MTYNYGYGNSVYGNTGYNNGYMPISQQTPVYQAPPTPPATNKIYVTSAEDALSRFANPNTITVYWLQDESEVYEVATDIQGKKNIRVRSLTDKKAAESPKTNAVGDFVTREEFEDFRAKLEVVLSSPKNTKKKVVDNDAE